MVRGTKTQEDENRLLSYEERDILGEVATKDPPFSQRAQALLAIDEGTTQTEAGRQAGLTHGQVRYWLKKFRESGMSAFPEELLDQATQDAAVDEVQPDLPEAEKTVDPVEEAPEHQTAEPAAEAVTLQEKAPEAKKKGKKKAKKKGKKKTQAKPKKKPKEKTKKRAKKKPKKKSKQKPKKQVEGKSKKGKKPAKKTKKKSKK